MGPDPRRARAAFVLEYRWALAFGVALAVTFALVPRRPPGASLAWDAVPAVALGAVWVAVGLGLGALARRWARADRLAVARVARR
ncbi:MAG: hypothetical protein R3B06_13180 [Kofleriaceae bacterium]